MKSSTVSQVLLFLTVVIISANLIIITSVEAFHYVSASSMRPSTYYSLHRISMAYTNTFRPDTGRYGTKLPASIVGFGAPVDIIQQSDQQAAQVDEVDYVVIGSGIGGLSCAALLRWYGYSVVVLESHYLAGGVAHTFEREGFKFDAGPSLWNGMSTKPYNPLREVNGKAFKKVFSIFLIMDLIDFMGGSFIIISVLLFYNTDALTWLDFGNCRRGRFCGVC